MWKLIGATAIVALAACHTRPPDADQGMTGGITEGVLAPLADLNMRKEAIPPILTALAVYEKAVPESCAGIEIEIADLESYVGSDVDTLQTASADGLVSFSGLSNRVTDLADDQAYSLVSDITTDFIPFRSMVRRATGATAHDRAVREAYRRGRLRRSYLKGVGFAMGCDGGAAPQAPARTMVAENDGPQPKVTFDVRDVPPAW